MEWVLRVLGLVTASIAVGLLVSTTQRDDNLPGWVWAVAGYVMFDVTLLYYRVRSLNARLPLNVGDVGFLLANVFVIAAFIVRHRDDQKGELDG